MLDYQTIKRLGGLKVKTMSREIEFRAFIEYKNLSCGYPDYNLMMNVHSIDFVKGTLKAGNLNETYKIKDVKLLEYTGKKDKNRVKIFEHDLIQLDGTRYIYEIVWDNESSSYKMQNKNDGFEWDVLELRTFKTPYITVLGNIYKNKELLGERNE